MTLQYIFSKQYLFDPVPTPESRLYVPLLIIFSIMILAPLLMFFAKNIDKNIRNRNFYALLIPGILGLLYIFCRYEQLPWFGSRLMLAIIVAGFVIWSVINFIWTLKYMPKIKQKKILDDRYLKYLPRKKGR